MQVETLSRELSYYAAHGAALFPIPAGQKHGHLVPSFKHDHSNDPAQWVAWGKEHPGCNYGVVAFASQWITIDIDTSGGEHGRAEAWALWVELCKSWGLSAALSPHCQSPSGGWHVYFAVPAHIDASTLRQPDAVKKRINIRTVGFTVAAGSTFEGKPYLLFPDAPPPHPAPEALIAYCTRAPRSTTVLAGSWDKGDVAALLNWLNDRGCFEAYEDWFTCGMALKLEYGDDGAELWALIHDETVTADVAETKWQSFSSEPSSNSITLNSLMQRAHGMGWGGNIRKSTAAMFDGVAKLAAASGASLASGMPTGPSQGIPMMAGQQALADRSAPKLMNFLAATTGSPTATDFPSLPVALSGHGLYCVMQNAISRIVALAESSNRPDVTTPLGVLGALHAGICESLCQYLETSHGCTLDREGILIETANLTDDVQRQFVKKDGYINDNKGLPEGDNPDNVVYFFKSIRAKLRWNIWLQRVEIKGFEWSDWRAVDDVVIARLKTRAFRTGTRFRPTDAFLKENILSIAQDNAFDPVLERVNALQWDGVLRLANWLSMTCGVANDAYHQAVARNVVGGMVKRVRQPGAKHDEMAIFIGPQGSNKSTMCRILALQDEWFSDSFAFDGSPQNTVPQLFGKLVVELGELDGMAKRDVQHIKAFLTRQVDNVTLKYKAFSSEHPRRCVFVGTSNEDTPLVDLTGNRRFLPVRIIGEINLDWLRSNIEQIVAEAATLEAQGETFQIPREVWGEASKHQEAARSVNDVELRLSAWFEETPFTKTAFVSTNDLMNLCDSMGWKNMHTFRNSIMRRLGFHEVKPWVQGIRTVGWMRGEGNASQATRYLVSVVDGRPRVTIRAGAVLPPLPYL